MRNADVSFARRVLAEFIGTAFLVAAIVGSGIMGERLSAGNVALALLASSTATGAALVALGLALGPISGAQLNPAVTLASASRAGWAEVRARVLAQVGGAVTGTITTHAMFAEPLVSLSARGRHGAAQLLGEFVATFGLVAIVHGCGRSRPETAALAVGSYIAAAYWFTSSTSFANPAVTIARALTGTFSGIRPGDVPGFIVAQLLGAAAATLVFRRLVPEAAMEARP